MSEVDRMVMFCLMSKKRINLVRLILDFIIAAVGVEKKKHASLPFGMFLNCVVNKAQFHLNGERADFNRHTTTTKTFQALGLKPQAQEKENKSGKKKVAITVAEAVVPSTKKSKSKPSEEGKKKKLSKEEVSLLFQKRENKKEDC